MAAVGYTIACWKPAVRGTDLDLQGRSVLIQEDLPAELRQRVLAARFAASASAGGGPADAHVGPHSRDERHMHTSASAPDLPSTRCSLSWCMYAYRCNNAGCHHCRCSHLLVIWHDAVLAPRSSTATAARSPSAMASSAARWSRCGSGCSRTWWRSTPASSRCGVDARRRLCTSGTFLPFLASNGHAEADRLVLHSANGFCSIAAGQWRHECISVHQLAGHALGDPQSPAAAGTPLCW